MNTSIILKLIYAYMIINTSLNVIMMIVIFRSESEARDHHLNHRHHHENVILDPHDVDVRVTRDYELNKNKMPFSMMNMFSVNSSSNDQSNGRKSRDHSLNSHRKLRSVSSSPEAYKVNCSALLMGQYVCSPPVIDSDTQQPYGCTKHNRAKVNCTLIEGLVCHTTGQRHFFGTIECQYTNGYSFETALLLSIFLGMFGADRFYLGFPALGLLKFSTLGFLFLGQLIDIVLIAMQLVRPADGSAYVIKYFGPRLTIVSFYNESDSFINYFNGHQNDWRIL